MKWLEVHLDTAPAMLETAEALLSSLGIDSVVIDDEGEFHEFLEGNRRCWDYVDDRLLEEERGKCRVTFYLESSPEGWNRLAEVRLALSAFQRAHPECARSLLSLKDLEDADWENNWKEFYHPIEIGERLLILPQWEKDVRANGRIPLVLNPGLAFGTGMHATTRLCLAALENRIRGGERVLDLGCGSGILSIAALKLGAAEAFACDIDDKCRDVAYENAALNGVDERTYTVRCGDILTDEALRAEIGGGYDAVLANIVADVIIGLAPAVRPLLKPGGVFICSGIIDTRAPEVAEHLRAAGLTILETREAEGWFSYLCQ